MGLPYELAHAFSDPECQSHGVRTVYDHHFRCLRCCFCGHRFSRGGRAVTPTRKLSPLLWPKEIGGRKWAKQTRTGTRRRLTAL